MTDCLGMIEREEWYSTYFERHSGSHYCTMCELAISSEYQCMIHLLREHDFDEVEFQWDFD